MKQVVLENDQLSEQLESTKREMQALVNLNMKHVEVARTTDAMEANETGHASSAEVMELKNRAHLLTEENNLLF